MSLYSRDVTSGSGGDHAIIERLEHELGVLQRRARGQAGAMGRTVHPELDSAAYGLLVRIAVAEEVRVTDLAEYFSVGKPTVSRQIALLEEQGLVTRARNSSDARSRHLELTESGRAMLERARIARREALAAQLATWPSADLTAFTELLQRFNRLL